MKRLISLILIHAMLLMTGACGGETKTADTEHVPAADVSERYPDAVYVEVSDSGIAVSDKSAGVTTANDIVYYEAGHDFTYGEGTAKDEHTADEAAAHTVVHITQPGMYVVSGTMSAGQIAVDLGKDAEDDPEAVVTLVLNGLDITCTVAPAVIFYNVYECGDTDDARYDVDTSAAGANVVIADGSVNNVNGAYVARIYKSIELSEDGTEVVDSKKLHKYDAAFYSKMSMNISGDGDGSGVLNINAENEGLDSELHLTVNSGIINITSGNDGINTNEDGVSVTTINGGTVNIRCDGSSGEGDGIDSNGWLVINGGEVYAQACAVSGDAGIDSDMGIYINGGTVMASGNMLDRIAGGDATYAVFRFAQPVQTETVTLRTDTDWLMAYEAENAYQYLILSSEAMTAGDYTLWAGDTQLGHSGAMTGGMDFGGRGQMPDDRELPEGFDPAAMENMTPPEGFGKRGELPEDFDPATMQRPEGMEDRTPPDGEMPMDNGRPDGFGGRGQGGMDLGSGEMSEIFTLADGTNQFSGIRAYEAAEA